MAGVTKQRAFARHLARLSRNSSRVPVKPSTSKVQHIYVLEAGRARAIRTGRPGTTWRPQHCEKVGKDPLDVSLGKQKT